MSKLPKVIEGDYAVVGERQPIVKSWGGLVAFFWFIALRALWVLIARH